MGSGRALPLGGSGPPTFQVVLEAFREGNGALGGIFNAGLRAMTIRNHRRALVVSISSAA